MPNKSPWPNRSTRYERLLPVSPLGPATTAVIDHGSNPGLVSHFAKQNCWTSAETLRENHLPANPPAERLMQEQSFAELAARWG